MVEQLRLAAIRYLPRGVRRPLGALAGKIDEWVIHGGMGLLFDLMGSRLRVGGCTFIIPRDVTTRSWRGCFIGDAYEYHERLLISRLVLPDDRVIELGACLGVGRDSRRVIVARARHEPRTEILQEFDCP